MGVIWAAFLGIVQGLTEFLPVSSSGHLVLIQNFIPGFSQPGVLFDVVLHLGTLLAIVFYFREKILNLDLRQISFILMGTIPAGVVGYFFSDPVEGLFESTRVVSVALMVTGLINLMTDRNKKTKRKIEEKSSLLIGLSQAFAIIPGISRSGTTIYMGSKLGINKKEAAEFSFLLSIPAVLGATFFQSVKHGAAMKEDLLFYLTGFFFAGLIGYFAIGLVIRLLLQKKFRIFGYYCLGLGIVAYFL